MKIPTLVQVPKNVTNNLQQIVGNLQQIVGNKYLSRQAGRPNSAHLQVQSPDKYQIINSKLSDLRKRLLKKINYALFQAIQILQDIDSGLL